MNRRKARLVIGATVGQTIKAFVIEQAKFFAEEGFEVHLLADFSDGALQFTNGLEEHPGIYFHQISMNRSLNPARDVGSLIQWVSVLRKLDPDLVVVGTPKAGLLGTLAATILRLHPRVYLLRGLRLEGLSGVTAVFNGVAERVACSLADEILCVSQSLREELLSRGLARSEKTRVLGWGGSNGVDTERFRPADHGEQQVARQLLGLPLNAPVVGFAGRLTPDKGLPELIEAITIVRTEIPNSYLCVVGDSDKVRPLDPRSVESLDSSWCTHIKQLNDMVLFYQAIDVFCLPSIREGLPNVNMEAAASGVPVVTANSTGCRDTVWEGKSGFLTDVGKPNELASALVTLLRSQDLRKEFGVYGRKLAKEQFDKRLVWRNLVNYFHQVLLS